MLADLDVLSFFAPMIVEKGIQQSLALAPEVFINAKGTFQLSSQEHFTIYLQFSFRSLFEINQAIGRNSFLFSPLVLDSYTPLNGLQDS